MIPPPNRDLRTLRVLMLRFIFGFRMRGVELNSAVGFSLCHYCDQGSYTKGVLGKQEKL